MAYSRYTTDSVIGLGSQLSAPKALQLIRLALKAGRISVRSTTVTTGYDRLDTLSGAIYGDSRYWWVLAAASDIGWGLQVPPGTVIKVLDLTDVIGVLS